MQTFIPFACLLLATAQPDVAKLKDFTNVEPKSLGIEFCPAAKDDATGFITAGKNDTALIVKLPSINDRTIKDLEKDMRPGATSRLGFLGKDESLLEIMAADNRFVVEKKGFTHQELAKHLHILGAVAAKHGSEEPFEFLYHGKRFKATGKKFKAYVDSPFDDGTKTSWAVNIWNVQTGKTLSYSLLIPHLIERYGFYEGKGTPYRVEPQAILDVLDFLPMGKQAK